MKGITGRQQEILDFIEGHIEQKGYPPTLREICRAFNISSTFGVKRHLDALRKKGYLSVESNLSRALSVVTAGKEKPAKSDARAVLPVEPAGSEVLEVPIIGRVAAGIPILALENIEGTIRLDRSMTKPDSFVLKVKGDSMIDAGIYEGDLLVIAPQSFAYNGDIVVARLGDEATVKRFFQKDNEVQLIAENPKYKPIIVKDREDFTIVGRVIGVMRWYN